MGIQRGAASLYSYMVNKQFGQWLRILAQELQAIGVDIEEYPKTHLERCAFDLV